MNVDVFDADRAWIAPSAFRERAPPPKEPLEPSQVRRVLCALDVERSGSTSLSLASLLAERFHASVDALYAVPARPKLESGALRREQGVQEQKAQDRLTAMLGAVRRRVCVSSFVTRGDATDVILRHSQRQASDLIVMASSPQRLFAGRPSTIAPVTAAAPCAVLTVGHRFRPAPPRRILVPLGTAGAERRALAWVFALASRFDAEVGVLKLGQPRSGVWKMFTPAAEPIATGGELTGLEAADVLAELCLRGIDAYEIAHPGGSDSDAVSHLCEAGAFDAVVMGLVASGGSDERGDGWVASVRSKTSVPVLSVRTIRVPTLFAPSPFDRLPPAIASANWAHP